MIGMIDYNTIRNGDTIYPDEELKALIYSRYGEHASHSYVVLDKGTTIGRKRFVVKETRTVLDDGRELEVKRESYEEYEAPRPLLLVKGDGRNRKASLDWEEIRKFRLSKPLTVGIKGKSNNKRSLGEELERANKLSKAKSLLAELGIDISALSA